MWPEQSSPAAFSARRSRLVGRLKTPAVFASGFARARNFPHNRYPFRAESHFLYLVGAQPEGALLVVADGKSTLYLQPPDPDAALWTGPVPSFDELSKRLEIEVRAVDDLRAPDDAATLPPQDADTADWLADLLGREIEPRGGDAVEGADRELATAMIELRLRHDDAAIAQLRQAAAVTEAAHLAGMAATRPGLREAAIRAAMEAAIVSRGMTTSYNSIVSVHGEVLHNERHDGLAHAGDLLLADVGAETPEGFAGDVTRTWPVSGRYSGSQREIYEVVLAAQRAAIDHVRPGVRYRDVHRVAGKTLLSGLLALGIYRGDLEDLYARGAHALFFPHGVGHLLGIDVHDLEDLGDAAGYAPGRTRAASFGDRYLRLDRDLEPGMAVTIEPGFYRIPHLLDNPSEVGDLKDALDLAALERFADVRGIRIEDDVLVRSDGCEVLTRGAPKDIAEVEAAIAR